MPNDPRITVFYDGDCPICRREIDALCRWDRHGHIAAQDIADPAFEAAAYGLSHEHVMARIHGRLPDGRIITGMEVIRALYRAAGKGWLMAWTGWPLIRPLADRAYGVFARHRLRLPGRRRR